MKKLFLIPLIIIVVSGLIFTGCPAPAPAPAPALPPIKIGVMFPLTGPAGETGEEMVTGVKFGFGEVGYEVAGRKIELIVEDSAGLPAVALDKARKLVEYDRVCMLIGPLTTGPRIAVSNYMSKVGIPNIHQGPNPLRLIEDEWTIMGGGAEPEAPSAMGVYAYDEMGLRKVTVITIDIVDGHGFLGAFMDAFKRRGGQVIQEQYVSFPCMDYAPYLVALKDADAVVAWNQGADSIRFLTQYHEFGIRKRMPLVAAYFGSFYQPFIFRLLPSEVADAMIGEYFPSRWTSLIETDISKRFVEAFKKRHGYTPDDVHSSPYLSVQVVLRALKATGGDTTPEKLRQAMLAVEFEAPEGPIRFDPETRWAIRYVYILKVDKIGEEYLGVPVYTYKDVPPRGF